METFSILYEDGTVIYLECDEKNHEILMRSWRLKHSTFESGKNGYSLIGVRRILHHPKPKEEEQEKPTVTVAPDSVIDADTQEVIEYFEQLGYKPEGVM